MGGNVFQAFCDLSSDVSLVFISVDAGKLAVDVAKGNVKLAPTNEVLSFRAYSAHRKLNRLRKSACRLFQSEEVVKVVQKLEAEVESKRLRVRKDKMMHADLGELLSQLSLVTRKPVFGVCDQVKLKQVC